MFQLNEEADYIIKNGSHEVVVFNSIPETGILQSQLMVANNYKIIDHIIDWHYFNLNRARIRMLNLVLARLWPMAGLR